VTWNTGSETGFSWKEILVPSSYSYCSSLEGSGNSKPATNNNCINFH